MKLSLIVILAFLVQVDLLGIERYSKGDTLINWATKLNLREHSNQTSKIIAQINNGEKVVVNQNKYFKEEDYTLFKNSNEWQSAITGKWVEIIYNGQTGFVFDSYLSKYDKDQILDDSSFNRKEAIRSPDFESYQRLRKHEGIIKEIGIGMEWGKTVYYLPDFSIEEAIFLIKKNHIDYEFGERIWKIDLVNQTVKMSENDGISWKEIVINRIENMCIIVIEDGV